jgi:hypothetical protein
VKTHVVCLCGLGNWEEAHVYINVGYPGEPGGGVISFVCAHMVSLPQCSEL